MKHAFFFFMGAFALYMGFHHFSEIGKSQTIFEITGHCVKFSVSIVIGYWIMKHTFSQADSSKTLQRNICVNSKKELLEQIDKIEWSNCKRVIVETFNKNNEI